LASLATTSQATATRLLRLPRIWEPRRRYRQGIIILVPVTLMAVSRVGVLALSGTSETGTQALRLWFRCCCKIHPPESSRSRLEISTRASSAVEVQLSALAGTTVESSAAGKVFQIHSSRWQSAAARSPKLPLVRVRAMPVASLPELPSAGAREAADSSETAPQRTRTLPPKFPASSRVLGA
jgi:hypothetical protein